MVRNFTVLEFQIFCWDSSNIIPVFIFCYLLAINFPLSGHFWAKLSVIRVSEFRYPLIPGPHTGYFGSFRMVGSIVPLMDDHNGTADAATTLEAEDEIFPMIQAESRDLRAKVRETAIER